MEELERRFLEGVRARTEVLESALEDLKEGSSEAEDSIRRISHSLRGSGGSYGYPEITEGAARVEKADPEDLPGALEDFLEILREVAARAGGQEAPGEPVHILMVEDDPAQALLAGEVVKEEGREVHHAETAAGARQVLDDHPVALVMLDLFLPDEDGREVLMDLRRRPGMAGVPVIVVSGRVGKTTKAECFALGADEFVEKPFDPPVLASAVRRQLEKSRAVLEASDSDSLTGLPNRAGLLAGYRSMVQELDRGQIEHLSVGFLDLDGFQEVNDRYGREAGDEILAGAASVLRSSLGTAGELGRWAGEEFLALFPGLGGAEAMRYMTRMRERLREADLEGPEGEAVHLTLSGGLAEAHASDELREVVARADSRALLARTGGGDRIVWEDDDESEEDRSVLLAEDDDVTASLIRHRLEKEGFRVDHYDNGLRAFQAAEGATYSLAILDVKIPGMDGFELLNRLRGLPHFDEVPVMMLTSMNREADIVRGFELGADDYVLKPFSPVELVARVRRLMRRS